MMRGHATKAVHEIVHGLRRTGRYNRGRSAAFMRVIAGISGQFRIGKYRPGGLIRLSKPPPSATSTSRYFNNLGYVHRMNKPEIAPGLAPTSRSSVSVPAECSL